MCQSMNVVVDLILKQSFTGKNSKYDVTCTVQVTAERSKILSFNISLLEYKIKQKIQASGYC